MLPLQARVDLEAMAMKGYSTFPKPSTSSECLVSYLGHSLAGSYHSAEVQSVYSTAPADLAIHRVNVNTVLFLIIQFSICIQFRCQNSSNSNHSV